MRDYASRKAENSRILKPHLSLRRRRMARACLLNLYRFSFKRSIIKANYHKFSQSRRITFLSKGLEGLTRYKYYSNYVKDLKSKQSQFQFFNKARKAFFSLDRNRIRQNYTKIVLKQSSLNTLHKSLQRWIFAYNEL